MKFKVTRIVLEECYVGIDQYSATEGPTQNELKSHALHKARTNPFCDWIKTDVIYEVERAEEESR